MSEEALPRKRPKKAAGGVPTWMVTFADLMALLLTLFVLLLSFSTMETVKFKNLAGNLRDAFGLQSFDLLAGIIEIDGSPTSTEVKHARPVPLSEIMAPDAIITPEVEGPVSEEPTDEPPLDEAPTASPEAFSKANKMTYSHLQMAMAEEIEDAVMDVILTGDVTIVRFPDQVSFPSGAGALLPDFLPILDKLGHVLEEAPGHLLISGHTDDIPISTAQYRSNWDLSAARAASVAHFLLEHTDIDPNRITVQGFADSRPLLPNDSPQNRAKNRRVEIIIQREDGNVTAAPLPEGVN